jgi:hypothetical protein
MQELMEHIDNVHLGRQYPCDRCERVLSNRRALIRHVRYVLTFTCINHSTGLFCCGVYF